MLLPKWQMLLPYNRLVFKEKIVLFQRKLSSLSNIKQNEKSTCIYKRGVLSEKYISFATVGKFGKEDGRLWEPSKIYHKMP